MLILKKIGKNKLNGISMHVLNLKISVGFVCDDAAVKGGAD